MHYFKISNIVLFIIFLSNLSRDMYILQMRNGNSKVKNNSLL